MCSELVGSLLFHLFPVEASDKKKYTEILAEHIFDLLAGLGLDTQLQAMIVPM